MKNLLSMHCQCKQGGKQGGEVEIHGVNTVITSGRPHRRKYVYFIWITCINGFIGYCEFYYSHKIVIFWMPDIIQILLS